MEFMEKSWKNALQEYCQARNLHMPIYYPPVRADNNKDNEPIWKSELKLFDGTVYNGYHQTKKGAEAEAAKKAMGYIRASSHYTKYVYIETSEREITVTKSNGRIRKIKDVTEIPLTKVDVFLLIDGDNCDLRNLPSHKNMCILVFVAKNTTRNLDVQNTESSCFIMVSESVGKDAADHLLTFTAGKLSVLSAPDTTFYVLTKDHFGEHLEKFMPRCKFICSVDEIIHPYKV